MHAMHGVRYATLAGLQVRRSQQVPAAWPAASTGMGELWHFERACKGVQLKGITLDHAVPSRRRTQPPPCRCHCCVAVGRHLLCTDDAAPEVARLASPPSFTPCRCWHCSRAPWPPFSCKVRYGCVECAGCVPYARQAKHAPAAGCAPTPQPHCWRWGVGGKECPACSAGQ